MFGEKSSKDSPMERWLIGAAQIGSSQALGALFDVNVLPLYRYAHAALNDVAAAEAVTEAVFQRLTARIGEYRPGDGPFVSWLMAIARTEVRSSPAFGSGPVLKGIPPELADVMLLRFAAGLSLPCTAAALRLKESKVRALQTRAMALVVQASGGVRPADRQGEFNVGLALSMGR